MSNDNESEVRPAVTEPIRILVVDEFSPVRNIIADLLTSHDYTVMAAENGREGLELARREQPDIGIIDWTVPIIDGIELTRQIKADPALESIYVILLIARLDVQDKVQALEVGADEYMVKPIDEVELGARVRAAVRAVSTKRRLEELARTDGLTGIANQRSFQEALSREVARSTRYDRAFSVLMMDVDDFKDVNDEYGHMVGDIVLKLVASFLVAHCRTSDTVARLGGDEFGVILPETDAAGAHATIARLADLLVAEWQHNTMPGQTIHRLMIRGSTGRLPKRPLHLSIGWSTSSPNEPLSMSELVRLADARMYEAKRAYKESRDANTSRNGRTTQRPAPEMKPTRTL